MCTEVGREGMEESWALGNPHWWRGRNAVKARAILFLVIQSQSYSILKLVINKRSPALKLKINITNIIIKIKFLNRSNIFLMMPLQYFQKSKIFNFLNNLINEIWTDFICTYDKAQTKWSSLNKSNDVLIKYMYITLFKLSLQNAHKWKQHSIQTKNWFSLPEVQPAGEPQCPLEAELSWHQSSRYPLVPLSGHSQPHRGWRSPAFHRWQRWVDPREADAHPPGPRPLGLNSW